MKLFLSRDKEHSSEIYDAFPNWEITTKSLIDFETVYAEKQEKTQWIFFTSRKTVDFYLDQFEITDEKIACIGASTANYLTQLGHSVKFVGQGNDTSQIGKDFANGLQGTVLFPQSDISLRKVQQELPNELVIDLVVYKTICHSYLIDSHDYYIFTSPSNIDSFFKYNYLPEEAKCFVLGSSSKQALISKNVSKIYISESPTMLSLIDCIKEQHNGSKSI